MFSNYSSGSSSPRGFMLDGFSMDELSADDEPTTGTAIDKSSPNQAGSKEPPQKPQKSSNTSLFGASSTTPALGQSNVGTASDIDFYLGEPLKPRVCHSSGNPSSLGDEPTTGTAITKVSSNQAGSKEPAEKPQKSSNTSLFGTQKSSNASLFSACNTTPAFGFYLGEPSKPRVLRSSGNPSSLGDEPTTGTAIAKVSPNQAGSKEPAQKPQKSSNTNLLGASSTTPALGQSNVGTASDIGFYLGEPLKPRVLRSSGNPSFFGDEPATSTAIAKVSSNQAGSKKPAQKPQKSSNTNLLGASSTTPALGQSNVGTASAIGFYLGEPSKPRVCHSSGNPNQAGLKETAQQSSNTSSSNEFSTSPALGQLDGGTTSAFGFSLGESAPRLKEQSILDSQRSVEQWIMKNHQTRETTSNTFGSSSNCSFSGNKPATATAIKSNVKSSTNTTTKHSQTTNVQTIVQKKIIEKEYKDISIKKLHLEDCQANLKEPAPERQQNSNTILVGTRNTTPALGRAPYIGTTSSTELNCSTRVRAQQSIQQSTTSRQRSTATTTTTNDVFGSSSNSSFSGNKSSTGTATDLNVKLSLQSSTTTKHNQITNIQIIVQNQILEKEDNSESFKQLSLKGYQAALKESAQQQQQQQQKASIFKFNSTTSSSNSFVNTQQNKDFGTTPGTSLFGNTGTAQQPQSTFGNVNNNQPSTLFGTQQSQNQSIGLFEQQAKPSFNTTPNTGFSFNKTATPITNTSLFGSSSTTPAFGQASKQINFGFGTTSSTGFSSAQQSTSFGQITTATRTNVFGSPDNTGIFGNKPTTGTRIVKFSPLLSTDTMIKYNQTTNIQTRHQSILFMKEYEDKSFEELRLEDYQAGLKGPAQQTGSLFNEPTVAFGFGNANTTTRKTTNIFQFNSTTSSSNLFVNTQQNKGFGTIPGANIFGNTNTAQQPPSIFGNVNNNQPSTLFGTQQAQNQSTALFGQQAKAGFNTTSNTNTSLFSFKLDPGFTMGTTFGQQQAPLFGTTTSFGTQQNTTQSLFNTSSIFSKPAQTGFSFNSTPASDATALGTNTSSTSIMNNGNNNNQISKNSSSTAVHQQISASSGSISTTQSLFNTSSTFSQPLQPGFSFNSTPASNATALGTNTSSTSIMNNGNNNNQTPQNSSSRAVHKKKSASSRSMKIRRKYSDEDVSQKVTPSQLSKKSLSDDLEKEDSSLLETLQPKSNEKSDTTPTSAATEFDTYSSYTEHSFRL